MREQLKLLEELQIVDAKLHEMEDALSSLPQKLKSLKDDVATVEALLVGERQQLDDVTRYKDELETGIKEDQDQLTKSKSKVSQVRTSKEYIASQKELEITRKSTNEREEELLKLLDAIEQFMKSIAVHEEELTALKKHVSEEDAETTDKMNELEKRLGVDRAAREKMAEAIPKEALRKYTSIRTRRGNAVVPAKNGVCMGCNMHLPPQLYNILQRADSIEHCPSCQRIVYYEPPPEK